MSFALDLSLPRRGLRFPLLSEARRILICGPSGVGKTTLLRCLAGLEPSAMGRCQVDGRELMGVPPHQRRVGWVPQDALLFPHADVRTNLGWSGAGEVEALAEALDLTRLLDRAPRRLSGGERQRVAIGRALAASPTLLLLDEPFSALDRSSRDRVIEVLARAKLPLVLVSHGDHGNALVEEAWEMERGGALVRVG